LASVDRTVSDLFARLEALGVDDETYVFFWTDHGLQWGEHGLTQKDYAYEESIRTPLIAWGPDVVPQDRDELIMAPQDLGATILDLSHAGGPTDGRSLRPLLRNEAPIPAWRKEVFLEFVTSPWIWAGLRTERWKYVEWGEGDVELYDLQADPFELESLHDDQAYAAVLSDLRARRAAEPRALAFREPRYRLLPIGKVGVPYSYALRVWGGNGPLTFTLTSGVLPPGLTLSANGIVSGTPTQPQPHRESLFDIRVCDGVQRRHQEQPHCFTKTLDLDVNP
jgi:arylsulfatase A-like enzyme